MRARAGFGVVLHAESRAVFQSDAFHGVVVQIDVGSFHEAGGIVHGLFEHPEAVVLAGDFAQAAAEIFHRVVEAAMAVVEFVGGQTSCACEQLLAQTDTKKRLAVSQHCLHGVYGVEHGRGIAGAVGKEEARWLPLVYGFKIGLGRENLEVAIALVEATEDVLFYPKIHYRHAVFRLWVANEIRFAGAHAARQFESCHAGRGGQLAAQRF